MKIVFVDQFGAEGSVREDLTVDYDGAWRDEIESYVDSLGTEVGSNDDGPQLAAVHQDILLEIPERVPVTEIERREE